MLRHASPVTHQADRNAWFTRAFVKKVLTMASDSPEPVTGLDARDFPSAIEERHPARPAPLAAGQASAQPATVSGSQPNLRISEAPTAAPTLGTVRDLPDAALGRAIGFRTPAVVLDGVTSGEYCLAAASLAGSAHLQSGSVRQDAYDFMATVDGRLVVVVADGLGSKTHSQVGARLFCEGVLLAAGDPAGGVLSGPGLMTAGAAHASQIARDAYGLDDNEISVVAAVAVFGSNGCELTRIGDVSAFAIGAEGQMDELFAADTTDYVNVVQASLPGPSPDYEEPDLTPARIIAVVTDGLATDIRTSAAIRSWLSQRWHIPLGPYAMGDSLRYRRQGSHDDRTAVVVWTDPITERTSSRDTRSESGSGNARRQVEDNVRDS